MKKRKQNIVLCLSVILSLILGLMPNIRAAELNTNLLANPGGEAVSSNGVLNSNGWSGNDRGYSNKDVGDFSLPIQIEKQYNNNDITSVLSVVPYSGDYYMGFATAGTASIGVGTYRCYQEIDISDNAVDIDNNGMVFNLSGWLCATGGNTAKISVEELDTSKNVVSTPVYEQSITADTWIKVILSGAVAPNARYLKVIITGTHSACGLAAFDDLSLTISSNAALPPVISPISDQAMLSGKTLGPLSFSVSDLDTSFNELTITADSSNTSLIPKANILTSLSDNYGVLSLIALSGKTGQAKITVSVSDGTKTTVMHFFVTVNNDVNMDTNLIVNGEGNIISGWTDPQGRFYIGSGKFTHIYSSPYFMYQDLNISKFSPMIDAGFLTYTASYDANSSGKMYIIFKNSNGQDILVGDVGTEITIPKGTRAIHVKVGGISGCTISNVNFKINSTGLPKITPIADQVLDSNTSTGEIPFTVGYMGEDVSLSATSSNPSVVPVSQITFGGSGYHRTICVTPVDGVVGNSTISIFVDGVEVTSFTLNKILLVESLTVSGEEDATNVLGGDTLQMNAVVTPSNASDTSVTWSITNGTGSATISDTGLLTATGAGTVTVKATANDASDVYGTLLVTISKANPSIGEVTYTGSTLYMGAVAADVRLARASESVSGILILDEVGTLLEGRNTYKWKFIPTDTVNYETVSGTIELTVAKDSLQSISSSSRPSKTDYTYGEAFNINGLTVTATYASGATKDVTDLVTYSTLAVGNTSVMLSYTDGHVTTTCEFNGITVKADKIEKTKVEIMGLTAPSNRIYNGSSILNSDFGTPTFNPSATISDQLVYTYYRGDSVGGSSLVEAPKKAGNYTLRITISDTDDIYTGYTDIPFTIGKATITVKADDKIIIKGGVLGVDYTASYTGFVGNDTKENVITSDAAISCDLTDTSTVGFYPIRISGGEISWDYEENYEFNYIPGSLQIVDKTIIAITGLLPLSNYIYKGRMVEDSDFGRPAYSPTWSGTPTYTYYSGGSANGSSLSGPPKDAGTYTLRVAIPEKDDTYAGYTDITFIIGKGIITATAENKSMRKGEKLPIFTVTYTGIVRGDTEEDILAEQVRASCETDGKAVGSYVIVAHKPVLTSYGDKNYRVGDCLNGKLSVSSSPTGGSLDTSSGGTSSTPSNIPADLPISTINALVKAGAKEFHINKDIAVISLDLETLKTIQSQIKGDVKVSVNKVDKKTLSEKSKAIVGNRPVFDFSITGENGNKVTRFGKGRVSITISYTLGDGEKAENVFAYYIDDQGEPHEVPDSVYDEKSKTLSFSTDHFSIFAVGYKEDKTSEKEKGIADFETITFTDITKHWAKEDIEFVTARGLFGGTAEGIFSPNMSMTRGMLVTVLGRLAKADLSSYLASSFTDVKSDDYYMSSIEWARENSIVNGMTDTEFAPNQAITREQMAVIIVNYAKESGFGLLKVEGESIFADDEIISSYAKEAVKQMQMAGIISGKNDHKFDPKGTATRAEVSAVLKRFMGLI